MADKITMGPDGKLRVPDEPISLSSRVTGQAWTSGRRPSVSSTPLWPRTERRRIVWTKVLAGEKAFNQTGNWLPDETLADLHAIPDRYQGPLTTPIGGGFR